MVIATVPYLRAGASLRISPLAATCPLPALCQGGDDECLLAEAYQQDGGLGTKGKLHVQQVVWLTSGGNMCGCTCSHYSVGPTTRGADRHVEPTHGVTLRAS